MNKMLECVSSQIFNISKNFNLNIAENEVFRELSLWRLDYISEKISERYDYLLSMIGNPVFVCMFNIALAQYFYPPMYTLLRDCTGQGVTLHLALILNEERAALSPLELKEGYNFLQKVLRVEKEIENFLFSELYADERLVMFLLGSDRSDNKLKSLCFYIDYGSRENSNKKYTSGELRLGRLAKAAAGKNVIIDIKGKAETDKFDLLMEACEIAKERILFVDIDKLRADSEGANILLMQLLDRELLFYNCDICYYSRSPRAANDNGYIEEIIREESRKFGSILKGAIWVAAEGDYDIIVDNDITVITYTVRDFGGKSIEETISEEWRWVEREPDIELQNTRLPAIKGAGIQLVKGRDELKDMKISSCQREKLIQLKNHFIYKDTVYNVWNMREKYYCSKGITVLFEGAPGTGKTMAARAVSRELGIPLYRVDMSVVMDKYIGETEKKLEVIFRSCENRNVILFFDEADVIFGKRSEIKDSKDKFANSSVSFILQRIEEYEGMVILATNFISNIDKAFLRRIKYVIPFHMPDARTRTEIWKSGFTKETPVNSLDLEFLGNKVELSGGYIKNIIINAAFMAAEDGGVVTMKHIVQSLENEYEKLGMVLNSEVMENYGQYLSNQIQRGS